MPIDERPPEDRVLPPQPAQKPFISLTTDALQDEFKMFQNHTFPLAERVRAGHRLLSTAAHEIARKDEKLGDKILRFLKKYSPPRASASVVVSVDGIPVRRIIIGGATEAYSDIALADDPRPIMQMLEEQRHERYYNTVLAPVIGYVLVKLADAGIIREHPRQLAPSFINVTSPLASDVDDDESETLEEEPAEDEEVDDEPTDT